MDIKKTMVKAKLGGQQSKNKIYKLSLLTVYVERITSPNECLSDGNLTLA